MVASQGYAANTAREIGILQAVRHPAVIQLVGWFQTPAGG